MHFASTLAVLPNLIVWLVQAMVSCAFNGLGLALVIPCVQSLVADYHPSEARGQAFGLMGLTSSFGEHSQQEPCNAAGLLQDGSGDHYQAGCNMGHMWYTC